MAPADNHLIDAYADRLVTGPRALTRLLALFDALSQASDGLSLADLSTLLNSPKSSLLNLLRPMVSEAYLIHGSGTYRLGPSMFRLAATVMGSWYVTALVRPLMHQLADATGESVLLSVLDRTRGLMTYMDMVRSPHPIHYEIAAGSVRPIYPSASGRVLLAFADSKWQQQYLSTVEFETPTATPITKASLRRSIEAIRATGLETSIDVFTAGLSALAAPLFDDAGDCVACLGIAGPSDRIAPNLETLQQRMRECAAMASALLADTRPLETSGHRRKA